MPPETLSPREIERYGRHLVLPEVGAEGQEKLKAGSVLLVGAGGLGSPLGLYLAAAGVGRIGLVDFDVVEESNLQRQVLFGAKDVGRRKVQAARERLRDLNPHIEVVEHEERLLSGNALDVLAGYDVVVDGTDNFPTRYLVNDASVLLGKPNVYGSVFRFEGQASVFWKDHGPCYRCVFPEPPPPGLVPSCAEGGVLGVLPGIVGAIQATETIKLLLGRGETLLGRLLLLDAMEMRFREVKLRRDPDCPVCGEHPTIRALIDYEAFCGEAPRRVEALGMESIQPTELKSRLDRGDAVVLLDVRGPQEWAICGIPNALQIPLNELPARVGELAKDDDIVVYCKMGARSERAAAFLRDAGYRATSLRGGILAWSSEVDPSVPRY